MSATRHTAVDYIAIAIGPALIMTLVGSLALFLARVAYQGWYAARLEFILALFVFAAVLVSRISIASGKGRAILFALPLAIATGLAMIRFGEIHGPLAEFIWFINFVLIGVVWWCIHKLTLDCTVLDNSQVQSEQGLLQLIGLDGRREQLPPDPEESNGDHTTASVPRIRALWERLGNPQRKRQTHGVWVVYFSMAALPLFGAGQWFIPPSDAAGRRYTFLLLCVYLLSGFGLLVTTALMSLRQYLRQRNLQMPNSMVKTWIIAGVTLVVAVLATAWVLPRSISDLEITQAPIFVSRSDLETADYALGTDGPRHDPRASRVNQQLEGGQKPHTGDGKDGEVGENDDHRNEDGRGKKSSSGGGEDSKNDEGKPRQSDRRQTAEETSSEKNNGGSSNGKSPSRQGNGSDQHSVDAAENEPVQPPAKEVVQSVVDGVWNRLKYLFYALLAAIAGLVAWKHRDQLRAAWREMLAELRNLLNRLLDRRRLISASPDAPLDSETVHPKAFATFADPFISGTARTMSAEQLIRYSFAALEAWAREQSTPRGPQQTPTEFADRLADRFERLGGGVRELCNMYCYAAYASQTVSKERAMKLDGFWRTLTSETTLFPPNPRGVQPSRSSPSDARASDQQA